MLASLVCLVALLAVLAQGAVQQVTITAAYPKKLAGSVYLRGDGCGLNWDKGLAMEIHTLRGSNNATDGAYAYSATVNCDASTKALEVKVLLNDKQWMLGANHRISTLSGEQMMYPWFYATKGATSIFSKVYSSELKNSRDVIVYTPPSYLENTLKTHSNILIMHDGQNLFDQKTSAFGAWMAQDTVDNLIIMGAMDEVVIIGPYNTPDRTNEYTYIYDPSEQAGGKGDLYLDFLTSTLLPKMLVELPRLRRVKERLGILGSSLGGLISCYAGWTRSDYGKVGCMSSSFWWDENDFQNTVLPASTPAKPLSMFYMDSGTSGGEKSCAEYTTQVFNHLVGVGFEDQVNVDKYIDQGASHNEDSWGKRFYIPMQFLYPPSTA